MYKLTTKNGAVRYADRADFVYRLPSGSPQVVLGAETATGIFAPPVFYNLPGFSEFDGPEAELEYLDGGAAVEELTADLEQAYELLYGGDGV